MKNANRILQLNERINMNESLMVDSSSAMLALGIIVAFTGILAFKFPKYNSLGDLAKGEASKALSKIGTTKLSKDEIEILYNKICIANPEIKKMLESSVSDSEIRKNLSSLGIPKGDFGNISDTILQLRKHHKRKVR